MRWHTRDVIFRTPWLLPLLALSACNGSSGEIGAALTDDSGASEAGTTSAGELARAGGNGNGNGNAGHAGNGNGKGGKGGSAQGSGGQSSGSGGSGGTASSTGGTTSAGGAGATSTGGTTSAGGGTSSTGGRTSTGGTNSTGGRSSTGGTPATGGKSSTGGRSSTGGTTATGGSTGTAPVTYTTNFDLTESPISENGAWTHLGQDWTTVATSGGFAYGTQALTPRSGASIYNDSYAYLTTPFPPDVSVSVTIHLPAGIDTSTSHEAEILLRWADGQHTARGYECNLSYSGAYAEIVRWNGPLGNYTYMTPQGSGGGHVPHDGDVFKAQIVGNTMTTYLNGVQLNTATDSMFTTGQPGIGFYRGANGAGSIGDYGFSSFTATSL